jgi:hypothetical protein
MKRCLRNMNNIERERVLRVRKTGRRERAEQEEKDLSPPHNCTSQSLPKK